ncbi:MAG: ClbS/DfsB family four-helix bundle protein [Caldilineaceae bacterium]
MTEPITSKAELLEAINNHWQAINQAINALSEAQMTTIHDAQGWTVKDHIAHMTAWERSALFFLQGKPRHEGLGVPEATYLSEDEDRINASIYQQQRAAPLLEVTANFHQVHHQLMRALEQVTDAELLLPYRHFLPDEPGEGDGPPGMNVVYGNSALHYQEHLAWMQALVEQ